MPRILLANEFGAGRGHVVTLTRLAQAFGPGFQFDAALARREHEAELYPLGADIFDGPRFGYRNARRLGPNGIPTATWGEFLGDLGFARVERIREIVEWWRLVLSSRNVGLVLADYGPLALLAARSLGILSVGTGTGYGLPPPDMPEFPVLEPEASVRLHDEAELLANVNQVATEIGLAPLQGLPEIYHSTLQLVRTLPMLDPYASYRNSAQYLPPVTDISPIIADRGDEVFVYFSTMEFDDPGVVEALATLPLPRRGYLPAPPPGVAERLAASGMILEKNPVPVEQIAKRSRLLLNAGQHGILCLGLFAGLPQVCLFQHREQRFHAQCAADRGVAQLVYPNAREAGALRETILAAYHNGQMQSRAKDLATELQAGLGAPPEVLLETAIAPIRSRLLALGD